MKTTINVTAVENKGKKMNILDNKTKYNFWITKQDGTNTKAMDGFQKLRPIVGDSLVAEVESKQASFQNAEGKTVNYTDNQILYFYTDLENHQNSQAPVKALPSIPVIQLNDEICEKAGENVSREEFDSLAKRVRELEIKSGDDVQINDIPW